MKESDYFYWRNPKGIIEKHHVSEFGKLSLKRSWEKQTSKNEDKGQPVLETGGEAIFKEDPQPVRELEKEDKQKNLLTVRSSDATLKMTVSG